MLRLSAKSKSGEELLTPLMTQANERCKDIQVLAGLITDELTLPHLI